MTQTDVVICTMAKNETLYIRDFCLYHKNLGFDRIIIYDNDDVHVISDIVKDIPGVEVKIWHTSKPLQQTEMHIDFLKSYTFGWCAFIDVDEFITLQSHENIKDFINNFDETVDVIRLSEEVYGDDELIRPVNINVPIYERIQQPVNQRLVKCKNIVKGGLKYMLPNPHTLISQNKLKCVLSDGTETPVERMRYHQEILNHIGAWIRHYKTKTTEEFCQQKLNRTRAFCQKCKLNADYYFNVNKLTAEKENFIKEYQANKK